MALVLVIVGCAGSAPSVDQPRNTRAAVAAEPSKEPTPVDARPPSPPDFRQRSIFGGDPVLLHARFAAADDSEHAVDLSAFIPASARVRQVWRPASRRAPAQVLVEWVDATKALDASSSARWGLTLAVQLPRKHNEYAGRWRGSAVPVLDYPPQSHSLNIGFVDVTGDGIEDLIVRQYPGTNHLCGPHQVITALPTGRALRVYAANVCETELDGGRGLLRITAPQPRRGDSVCCASAQRHIERRWTGQKYVTVRDQVLPT